MIVKDILTAFRKYRLLIIFAIIFLGYRLIISPYIYKYRQNKEEIKNLENKLSKAIPLLADEESVNSLYNSLTEVIPIQTYSEKIDWDKLSQEVFDTLYSIANKYNVKILTYRPRLDQLKKTSSSESESEGKKKLSKKEKTVTRSFKPMEIDVDLETGLANFIRFVYHLERSEQLMEVEEVVITASGKKGISTKLKIKKIIF